MANKPRPAVFRDRKVELATGLGLWVVATYLIWDAYEGRGRSRPFATRFLAVP